MDNKPFLQNYSGQSTQELIELASEYRIDSIVLAFEEALDKKLEAKKGIDNLTIPELTILAVEAMEREVNNGGWSQFFLNSSGEYTKYLHDSLIRINCPKIASIANNAINTLNIEGDITQDKMENILLDNEEFEEKLSGLDSAYYSNNESIAEQLFEYIKNNTEDIKLS